MSSPEKRRSKARATASSSAERLCRVSKSGMCGAIVYGRLGISAHGGRSLTVHRDNEFNWIIECDPGWDDCTTGLQVTPLQRAVDAVEDQDNALFRSFDSHFQEALEEGCAVEVEDAGKGLNAERPRIKPLYPVPERLFP